ncbi:hypothetical protein PF003_g36567 [Phytophthora fragariae]|uniref:Retrotransposon gag domain-containing protein n=1 Tax=Phytophthora fragariae TaxID=53985 RepID=A0A6A3EHD1_9STRA|nr:hypothetical protein PF003_g36567 [Phytophthora fragariae]KAE8930600.1 hypothetical protein PF009_g19316 [Phytophthora fragariae]
MAPTRKKKSGKSKMTRRPKTRSVTQTRDDDDDGDNEATTDSEHDDGAESGSASSKRRVAMMSPAPTDQQDNDVPADTMQATSTARTASTGAMNTPPTAAGTASTVKAVVPSVTASVAADEGRRGGASVVPATQDTATMVAAIQQLAAAVCSMQTTITTGTTPTVTRSAPPARAPRRTPREQRRGNRRAGARRSTPDEEPSDDGSSSSSTPDEEPSDDGSSSSSSDSSEESVDDSSSSSDDAESSSSSSSSADDEAEFHRRQGERERRRHHNRHEPVRRQNVKDLELPTYVPSPEVSVSTWIDRIDLILTGAEESGRGSWTDRSLYFIVGGKLQEDAARWWVNLSRRLNEHKKRWSYLKRALLRRYGERLDKATAEWRVNSRVLMPGETYADFGAGLRSSAGRNKVRERVFVAQFIRCLDKTTRKLVLQDQKPKTLEKAIKKATKIDDPYDNVARGMTNIGQPWPSAPTANLAPMTSNAGQTTVIPGIGSMNLPLDMMQQQPTIEIERDSGAVTLFTNPQGGWSNPSGTWTRPPGREWNGKYWAEKKKAPRKKPTPSPADRTEDKKSAKKLKMKQMHDSIEDEPDVMPRKGTSTRGHSTATESTRR